MYLYKCRKAFTLIELLVVVAIIVVLIAILLPSLGRARENAKSAGCMSNLKQWGTAVSLYENENNQKLPHYGTEVPSAALGYTSVQFMPMRALLYETKAPLKFLQCPSDLMARPTTTFTISKDTWTLGIVDPAYGYQDGTTETFKLSYGINQYAVMSPRLYPSTPGIAPYRGAFSDQAGSILMADASYFLFTPAFISRVAMADYPTGWPPQVWQPVPWLNPSSSYTMAEYARHKSAATANVLFMDLHVEPVTQKAAYRLKAQAN